jgi:hypothetical protein
VAPWHPQFEVACQFVMGTYDSTETYCDNIRAIITAYLTSVSGFWFDCTTSVPWSYIDMVVYQVWVMAQSESCRVCCSVQPALGRCPNRSCNLANIIQGLNSSNHLTRWQTYPGDALTQLQASSRCASAAKPPVAIKWMHSLQQRPADAQAVVKLLMLRYKVFNFCMCRMVLPLGT